MRLKQKKHQNKLQILRIQTQSKLGLGFLKLKSKILLSNVKEFAQHESHFFQKDVICHQDVNP